MLGSTVTEALGLAIDDYNSWAERSAMHYDSIKAYTELRGIFFNKLRNRLCNVEGWRCRVAAWRGGRTLYPTDIKMEVSKECQLAWIDIPFYQSHSIERTSTLQELHEACKAWTTSTKASVEYKLDSIIKQIKDF